MRLVVDANIIIAAILKKSKTLELLFLESLELFVPEHLFIELEKHRALIKQKTLRGDEECDRLIKEFCKVFRPVPFMEYSDFLQKSRECCPDSDDVMYFALAMKMNCPLWSNEKRLKNQRRIKVYSTQDLLEMLKY